MERLAGLPKRHVLLVKPDFGVSTPEAYRKFDEEKIESARGTTAFFSAHENDEAPYQYISNDLETALANIEIAKIRRELLDLGAEAAQMTGSGSCVFGLFSTEESAKRAQHFLAEKYPFCELCETI